MKKPKIKRIRVKKEKNKREKVSFKQANFSIKSNQLFYAIVLAYSVLLFVIGYFTLGLLITAAFMVFYFFVVALAMVMDRYTKRSGARRLVKIILLVFVVLAIVGIMLMAAFFMYISLTSPKFDTKKLEDEESTLVYDKNNVVFATIGTEKREKLTYDELSEVLIDAIIATEDSRFFQHNGLDAPRFAKAVLGQLLGQDAGGGSTLTMQVAKLSFTSSTSSGIKGIIRKFTDIYLSVFKIEKTYTKEEILEFYANKPFLGSQANGVEQASLTYFGKSAKDLNLSEAALIAGLLQSPSAYDPNIYPEKAQARRTVVLSLMKRHGYITEEEEALANAIPVQELLVEYRSTINPYQGYLDYVLDEVESKTGLNPYRVPMLIYTNMDTAKQAKLNKIMDGTGGYKWKNSVVQAGVAAVNVKNGKIIALGSGRNRTGEREFSYASSKDMKRQIGSTAKPLFDYGPGIEYNNWSTYTMFKDEKYTYSNGGKIENYDRRYKGWQTLRQALQGSRNISALKAFQLVDNSKIIEFVTSLGITPEIDSTGYLHEAHAIGGFNGSNPLEMAAAYAAFSNGGYYYEPYAVNKIVLRNDKEETMTYSSKGVKVMSEATAYMITNILYTGVGGTIDVRSVSGVPLAAKTGTTNFPQNILRKYKMSSSAINDAWIVGYSPTLAIGMWYGYKDLDQKYYNTSSVAGTQRKLLYQTISKALYDKTSPWKQPSSVVKVGVEKMSNPAMLPSEYTPKDKIVYELFKKGTEPTETSPRYVPLTTPNNLLVTYANGTSTISWDPIEGHANINAETFGELGYEIYYNDAYVGFTTLTTYTYDTTYPYGNYVVKAAYNLIKDNRSSGASYMFVKDPSLVNLSARINGDTTTTLPISSTYSEPAKPVVVFDNLIDVTSGCTITKNIYNQTNGSFVGSSIDSLNALNTSAGTYRIVYNVQYSGISATATKIVKFE